MAQLRLDETPAMQLVAGAMLGIALYLLNFEALVGFFPGWPTCAASTRWQRTWSSASWRACCTGGSREPPRSLTVAIAIALIGTGPGLGAVPFPEPWYFTPIASNWHAIDTTICHHLLGDGHRVRRPSACSWPGRDPLTATAQAAARSLPAGEQEARVVAAGRHGGGVAAMLAPGLLVWADVIHVPKDAQVVEVVAQQWHWSYRLPGKDGKLGTCTPLRRATPTPSA
jgi:hypothetical protein